MFNFDQLIDVVKQQIGDLAESEWSSYKASVIQSGDEFLQASKDRLKNWTEELASGQLSKEDFEFLVKGLKDLAKMEALKRAGLTLIQLDKLRNSILNMIIGSTLDMISK